MKMVTRLHEAHTDEECVQHEREEVDGDLAEEDDEAHDDLEAI